MTLLLVGDIGSYIKPMGHLNKYHDYALFGDLSYLSASLTYVELVCAV